MAVRLLSACPCLAGIMALLMTACGGGGSSAASGSSSSTSVQVRATPAPDPPAPVSAPGLANLVAFSRLSGYVRHFHPTAAVDAADWGTLVREGMRAVESATSPEELANRMQLQLAEVAPLVQVFPEGANPPLPAALLAQPPGADRLQWWDTLGWSPEPPVQLTYNPYHRRLQRGDQSRLPAGISLPSAPFEMSIGAGLRCRIPMSLYADAVDALPRAHGQSWRYASLNADDRSTRLADISLFWNVIQHHHPYLNLLPAPWMDQLPSTLTKAAVDADARAFSRTLRELYAALQDSHGSFSDAGAPAWDAPPLVLAFTEAGWVVAQVLPGAPAGVSRGDLVVQVDGQPIAQVWADFQAHTPGSPQWLRAQARRWMLAGPSGRTLTLDLQALDGTPKTVVLNRNTTGYWLTSPPLPQPTHGTELRPGILYLDLSQLDMSSYQTLLPKILAAKGIVADRRRYYAAPGPDAFESLLALALKTPITSGLQMAIPRPLPDQPLAHFDTLGWAGVAPSASPMRGKLVFIQDGQAISYSESLMTWVQASGLPILGEASAGADGNVTYTALPGGFTLTFTGMRCLKIDGSQLQIVGITPTQPVGYTRAAIAQGKDDLVEAALALLDAP